MKLLFYTILIATLAVNCFSADIADNTPVNTNEIKWEQPISNPDDPNELLKVKWDAMAKVLGSESLEVKEKEVIIEGIIDPIFDYSLMSYLALGKTNWAKLSSTQRSEFTSLFVSRLKKSYLDKISLYKNQQAVFKKAVLTSNSIQIPMELVSDDDMKITLLYKLRHVESGWKIYDMEIQGVSILLTYRSQFSDILSNSSVSEFLKQLRKPESPEA